MAPSPVEVDELPRRAMDTFENELRNSALTAIVARHAGLILTLGYAFLAAVGMTYNFFFFASFGINVLQYSDTSDFIVAAVQSPVVIVLCLLPALIVWFGVGARRWVRRRSPRYHAYALHHETMHGHRYRALFRVLLPLLVLVYAGLFTSMYAQYSSNRLLHGVGRRVHVTRTTPVPSDNAARLLIGTTSKYLFLYDTLTKSTDILPVDNVAAITVALPASRKLK